MKRICYVLFILILLSNFYIFSQDQTSDSIKDKKIKKDTTVNNDTKNNTETTENNKIVDVPKNGWELYQDGRYYDSIIKLREEMNNFPARVNVYVIMGWDYRQLRRYKEMEEVSLNGLKLNSNDIRLLRNLGEAYFFQNKFSNAINEFQKYISLRYNKNDSFVSTVYYYLGVCFYNLGSFRKADIALSTANYYQQNEYKTILLLGKIMIEFNKYDKAEKYFNEVLKLSPNNSDALEGLKRIKDTQ